MESSVLYLNVERATGLEPMRRFFGLKKMKVYAVVSISSDPKSKQKTKVDEEHGENPIWDSHMQFIIDDSATPNISTLVFTLWCKRRRRDKKISQVRVPVRHLLNPVGDNQKTEDVEPAGKLFISYGFGKTYISRDDAADPPEKKLNFYAKLTIRFVTSAAASLALGALNTVIS